LLHLDLIELLGTSMPELNNVAHPLRFKALLQLEGVL
jgi:hypothetical protein